MEFVTLNNGVKMPLVGFGVYLVSDLEECERSVSWALSAGYRLIDTAAIYKNEEAVGAAIKKSGIPRDELFITTKVWIQDAGEENAKKAYEASLEKLGLDYVDLYLIHQPFGDYYGSWRAMEKLYRDGRVRAIGVSNFNDARYVDITVNSDIVPAVNQVETHPFFQQNTLREAMAEYGTQHEAWGPLAEAKLGIFENETLVKIAKKHNKSVAQVVLRWNVDRKVVVIPKSVHRERIEENFNIWDFKLDAEDIAAIAALDRGRSELVDHQSAKVAKVLNSWKAHD
ncbi:MAG: aldo/keto reductase [Clostridia bacterium]|nr:aldo/keto reductase [Clostridia bacterium]MBQ1436185.1 aldo/keto reductase [Clostridia bacterium]MBQ4248568.1 aldo/keto reductase [Clostridia bacterium]